MEGYYRSKSCREGGRNGANGMQDLRSYSLSHASMAASNQIQFGEKVKIKKGKNLSSSSSKNWTLNDPELQRKKRVASYKAYTMEGKMKGSFRKSFKWIKDTCTYVVYGWR